MLFRGIFIVCHLFMACSRKIKATISPPIAADLCSGLNGSPTKVDRTKNNHPGNECANGAFVALVKAETACGQARQAWYRKGQGFAGAVVQ